MAQISSCLCNMHIEKRYVWLTRHGRSEDNAAGRLGGDSSITDIGLEYARRLAMFVESSGVRPLVVWTSTLKRTKETAQPLLALPGVFHFETPLLNEIDAGLCEGTRDTVKVLNARCA